MVDDIAALTRETATETGKPRLDARVIAILGEVPRHRFVPRTSGARPTKPAAADRPRADHFAAVYRGADDRAHDAAARARVLEIGTGSGYQAAILAQLAQTVYTIEIVEPLGGRPRQRLRDLGYAQRAPGSATVTTDGRTAAFDAIVVTAAASTFRRRWSTVEARRPDGDSGRRTVSHPATDAGREEPRRIDLTRQILPVRFVPLTGKH